MLILERIWKNILRMNFDFMFTSRGSGVRLPHRPQLIINALYKKSLSFFIEGIQWGIQRKEIFREVSITERPGHKPGFLFINNIIIRQGLIILI
jgi:hypothetical protein